ncbi:hypothetical protein AC482_01960 [miscellaneous Crenarchaeota group-15 archaeon DG-45]|uniref:KaiC-like domain-containing protein n=1 Tax=miscellaneous Crenarchaeota group-15 archaeon DG-45 TaxID=1685127 RepID=A0A0M0BRP7_9ARCH|nr:MAG: hypothetical protein AC482_01960 [miscellaneous Crenarchaeota group-15 archaeon DG-45]
MEDQIRKALEFLRQDLRMEEEAAALYARQAEEMEEGWLRRIFLENVADEERHAEIFRYAIDRVEYSAANPTVSTGIDELDDILYGGVPEGYAVILISPPLDERDLLTEGFLRDGVDRDEAVLLITTRLRGVASGLATERPDRFYLMLCSPRADLMVGDGPNVLKFQGVENLTQLNIALERFLRGISERGGGPRRVVLDIVSDTLLTHELRVARSWLTDLLTMLKAGDATVLSTLDPDMHSRDEARTVIDLFDGHMDIEEREADGERRRTLTVRRLYGKKYLDRELVLDRDRLTRR